MNKKNYNFLQSGNYVYLCISNNSRIARCGSLIVLNEYKFQFIIFSYYLSLIYS